MKKLDKLGKGIILMHDFHKHTAEALPELLRRLKAGGYKVVQMRAKAPVQTLAAIRRRTSEGRQIADRQLRARFPASCRRFRNSPAPRDNAVPALRIEGYVIVSADGMLANAERRDAGRTEIRGRQAVLHRRPRPRRPDRARPPFL